MNIIIRYITLFILLAICFQTYGQRIEIDRLERDYEGNFRDREAFELSQKFIQIDSAYYTGHYFEGLYRYFRASDQLGYQAAISPLLKAMNLMDKDFRRELRRTTDVYVYINLYHYQRKYAVLVNFLARSYQYIGKPDKSLQVLRKLVDKNFVFNFGVDPYATTAWIYHRNRTYGPEKHAFLKSSIEENVRMASIYTDSILIVNRKNQRFINTWFPNFKDGPRGNYFHYKDLLYSYLLNVDSAEYCAKQLKRIDLLSKNNYGNLQFLQAKFDKAEEYYNRARDQDSYQIKSTKEFDYMESAINIFKNDLFKANALVENSMNMLGPTPGFGWNNIAMARVQYYVGDLEKSKKHRDKAANFKELHINSTWGKLNYDRNTLLFDYLYHERKIKEIQFLNQYYWLNLNQLKNIALHYFKKENSHLLLTSDLSSNPERFLVHYNIFSSENTIFFDELWEVIKTFNSEYFINLFERKMKNDERDGILKYYQYFIAKFHLEDGNDQKAIEGFSKILEDETLDPSYEKLLVARVYEGLSIAFENLEQSNESDQFLLKFYNTYPQLVPFSPMKMKFRFQVKGEELSDKHESVIEELKQCNIQLVENDQHIKWPTVSIEFLTMKDDEIINFEIDGNIKQKLGIINLNETETPGRLLAYRMFDIASKLAQ